MTAPAEECPHTSGHEVFLGREVPGNLASPERHGWQCWGCSGVFPAPPTTATAVEPQPPPAAAPPITNSPGAPIPKPDRLATADDNGSGQVRQESARQFLAGSIAGYLSREGWPLLDVDPDATLVASLGLRFRVTVSCDGPLTDSELELAAAKKHHNLRGPRPAGATVLDIRYLNLPEHNCAECAAVGASCGVHYHERLTVLGGQESGSADRRVDGA